MERPEPLRATFAAELAHQWSYVCHHQETGKSRTAATASGFWTTVFDITHASKMVPCPLPLHLHETKDQMLRSQLQWPRNSRMPLQLTGHSRSSASTWYLSYLSDFKVASA